MKKPTLLTDWAKPALDISNRNTKHPVALRLSNFTERPFVLDGIEIKSMESFLQALKFSDVEKQIRVCSLPGRKAKYVGKRGNKRWQNTKVLYWGGEPYHRHSKSYQVLLERAYLTCFNTNQSFCDDLAETGYRRLKHSIGKSDPNATVLTEKEFIRTLKNLRGTLRETP